MEFHLLKKYYLLILVLVFWSCEKEIEIDVPAGEEEIVIEGTIENGRPPVVLVSRTRGFFEPTSSLDIANSYIDNAIVSVNGIPLETICTDEIPEELAEEVSALLGIAVEDFDDLRICAYVGADAALIGEENKTYDLRVEADGKILTATTHIPKLVQPDSVWFRLWANSNDYGYGFFELTDPDTLNNAYRIFTQRIGPNMNDNPVDATFYAPFGSAFIDEFFNSETIEVIFVRGQPANSSREVDTGPEAGFFELGDRFVLKFCSQTQEVYNFYRTFEAQQGTNGSPFSAPGNIISNINGGLGVWAGSACTCDTVTAQ